MARSFLRLEHLEHRLTPATKVAVPIILPPPNNLLHVSQTTTVTAPTSGQGGHVISLAPAIGVTMGSSGSSGSTSGGSGLGSTTGDPLGTGPGN